MDDDDGRRRTDDDDGGTLDHGYPVPYKLIYEPLVIYCIHAGSTFSNKIRFRFVVPVHCLSDNVSAYIILMK